jgi:hypothetical protein
MACGASAAAAAASWWRHGSSLAACMVQRRLPCTGIAACLLRHAGATSCSVLRAVQGNLSVCSVWEAPFLTREQRRCGPALPKQHCECGVWVWLALAQGVRLLLPAPRRSTRSTIDVGIFRKAEWLVGTVCHPGGWHPGCPAACCPRTCVARARWRLARAVPASRLRHSAPLLPCAVSSDATQGAASRRHASNVAAWIGERRLRFGALARNNAMRRPPVCFLHAWRSCAGEVW